MKSIFNLIVGLLIGGVFGMFFGALFGVAVTKKSEQSTREAIQIPLFGIIGAIAGAAIASQVEHKSASSKATSRKQSLHEPRTVTACSMCKKGIGYNPNKGPKPLLCQNCASQLSANKKARR